MGLSSRERRRVLVPMVARLCRPGGGESNAHSGLTGVGEEMRIVDVLQEGEDEPSRNHSKTPAVNDSDRNGNDSSFVGGGRRRRKPPSSSCSPRCLLSRWLPSRQSLRCGNYVEGNKGEVGKEQGGKESGELSGLSSLGSTVADHGKSVSGDREEDAISTLEAMTPCSVGGEGPVGPEEPSLRSSEGKPEQLYLNIGAGAGLVFLLTQSATEFNKMISLRSEMEKLLKETKDLMLRNNVSLQSGGSKNNLHCSVSDSCGNIDWRDLSVQDRKPCLEMVEASCRAEIDGHSTCDKGCKSTKSLRIDQIEAELESELELLELSMDKQESSGSLGVELPAEVSDHSESFSVSLGQHPEPNEYADEESGQDSRYGVCPHELRRRLHELLQTQQQERIAELESALELAQVKLRERDMEIAWWRDTAQLVSQRKQGAQFRLASEQCE